MIRALQREALSKQIYDDLVRRIRKREFRSGDSLVVRSLQAEYGVSSTPVRDAINLLSRYGFLDVSSEQRISIIHMDREKVFDWLDYMRDVHKIAVRYCFKYNVEKSANAICPYAKTLLACDPADAKTSLNAYLDMVNSFIDNCGNQALARAADPILGGCAVAFGTYEDVFPLDACRQDARAVLEGFEKRDITMVQSVMDHLSEYLQTYAQKAFPPESNAETCRFS